MEILDLKLEEEAGSTKTKREAIEEEKDDEEEEETEEKCRVDMWRCLSKVSYILMVYVCFFVVNIRILCLAIQASLSR